MKKTICLLLIASLVVAMAAVIGCGSSEEKPELSVGTVGHQRARTPTNHL